MPLADLPPDAPLVQPVEIALTSERVRIGPDIHMGLTGLHYRRRYGGHWSAGAAVFGATQGDRGGFFGWGVEGAYSLSHGPWRAEAGLFVGGGGGSPAWVGGGYMWRPHAQLGYAFGPWVLALGASHVRLPGGPVDGTQPYLSLAWQGERWLGDSTQAAVPADAPAHAVRREVLALGGVYRLSHAVSRAGGPRPANDLRYGGAGLRRDWGDEWQGFRPYTVLTAVGAVGGGFDGYAELMGGAGVSRVLPMLPSVSVRAEALVGSGGAGGTVDTGGGLLRKGTLGVSWAASRDVGVSFMAGRVASRGPFEAREMRLELALRGWDVLPGVRREGGEVPQDVSWAPWAVSAGWLSYPSLQRDDGTRRGVGLMAWTLEREVGPNWRLIGRAATAAQGGAGGYATGQLGVGWLTAPLGDWRWGGEAALGAAGGGGVTTGGGLFAQVQAQARYAFAPGWSVQLEAGRLRNRSGSLSSAMAGVGVVRSFALLQGR